MRAFALAFAILAAPQWSAAQTSETVPVATIATAIVDREPQGAATAFDATVGRLYCFTRVVGLENQDIQHVWYHGDEERARVTLAVRAPEWRTWSSKNIAPEWTGAWRVEIQRADGTVLQTVEFTIR